MVETKKSFCRFCHVFCGIEVDVDIDQQRVLAVRGDRDNPFSQGYTCIKGRAVPEEIHHPDRLLSCKKRVGGTWADVGSGQALDEIAAKLLAIRKQHGPRAIAAYVAGGAGFAAAGVPLSKAWLTAVGSSGFYTSFTNDCPGYVVAAHRFFGTAATPLGLYAGVFDMANADVAMFIGANPVVSHRPCMPQSNTDKLLRDAQKRGMKLIVVDPRRTEMARRADLHLQVKPGEDATLLAGMIKTIIERQLYDRAYVEQHVSGLAELHAAVKDFDLEYVARRTLVPADLVAETAVMFATAKSGAVRDGAGVTMARHQNLNLQLVYTLNALCGRIDRKGGLLYNPGVFSPPFPEHGAPVELPLFGEATSRVRGLRGMFLSPGHMEMPTATLADEILEPGDGRIRALLVHGGNPVATFPDQDKTVRALQALELLVVVDPFMTATANLAHYVIPTKHFLERPDTTTILDATFPFPFGQYTPAVVRAPADLLEEWEIGWELAGRMGLTLNIPGLSTEHKPTSDEVLAAFAGYGRVPLEEVRKYPSGHVFGDLVVGAVLPHAITHPDKKMAAGHPEVIAELREVRAEPLMEGGGYEGGETFSHRLIAIRMDEVYNSKGQNLPSLQKKHRFNPAFMNPQDLQHLGVTDGEHVVIESSCGRIRAIVEGNANVMSGVVAMAHAWGGELGSPTGRLIPDDLRFDPLTGMALLSAIPVNVQAG